MPSFRIRDRKVLGFMPKSSAAPPSPLIFQELESKVFKIWLRSTSSNFSPSLLAELTVAPGPPRSSKIFRESPLAVIPVCSISCAPWNGELPGQVRTQLAPHWRS